MKNLLRRMTHTAWVVALLTLFFAGANTAWGVKITFDAAPANGTVKVQWAKYGTSTWLDDYKGAPITSGLNISNAGKFRFIATPASGYKSIKEGEDKTWKVKKTANGVEITSGVVATLDGNVLYVEFPASGGDKTLEVSFVSAAGPKPKYKVFYKNELDAEGNLKANGKLTVSQGNTVVAEGTEGVEFDEDTEFTFALQPNAGYELEYVKAKEGASEARVIDHTKPYKLYSDVTFTASFKKAFTVKYESALQGGDLFIENEAGEEIRPGTKVFEGTKLKVSYGAKTGYEIASVTKKEAEDTAPVEIPIATILSYKLTLKSDVTFAATFKKLEVKLTIGSYLAGADGKQDLVEVWYNGEKRLGDNDNVVKLPYNALVTIKPIAPEALKGKFAGCSLGNILLTMTNALGVDVNRYLTPSQTIRLRENATVTATYGKEVTVKLPTLEHGTLTAKQGEKVVADGDKFVEGTLLHLTFAPAEGYKLKHALINGEEKTLKGLKATYTIQKGTNNESTIAAVFEAKAKYKVTYTGAVEGGTFTVKNASGIVASGTELYEGTELTFEVKPADGKVIDTFRRKFKKADGSFDEESVSPTSTYSLDMELEFVATFRAKNQYMITVNVPANGTLEVMADGTKVISGQKYDEGAKLTFKAKANDETSNKLVKVYDEGYPLGYLPDGKLLTGNMVITALIRPFNNLKVYYETLAGVHLTLKNEAGSEDIASGATVREDSKVKFVLSNEHYDYVYLSANGTDIENPGDLFTITENMTFDYAVTKKLYTVNYEKRATGAHGELTVKVKDGDEVVSGTKYPYETEFVFETKADENYKLEKITVDGETVTAPYKLQKDVTFVANFVEKSKHKVKYTANPEHGTLEVQRLMADGSKKKVDPDEEVYEGTELYFVTKPSEAKYALDKLQANNVDINPTAPYIVTAEVEFKAIFGDKKLKVRLYAPDGVEVKVRDDKGTEVVLDQTELTAGAKLTIQVTKTPDNVGVKKITFYNKEITETLKDGVYTATMGDELAYIAIFLNQKYDITLPTPLPDGVTKIEVKEGNTLIAAGTKVEEGKSLTVEVTTDRTITAMKLGDNDAELKDGKWTVVMPAADAELKLTFKARFAINFTAENGWELSVKDGDKTINSQDLVEEGKTLTVTVKVPNRTVKSITLGSNTVMPKADGSFEVVMPAEVVALTVNLVAQFKVGFYNNTPEGVTYEAYLADGTTKYFNNSLIDAGSKLLVKVTTTWTVVGVTCTTASGVTTDYETANSNGLYEIEVPEENSTLAAKLKPHYTLSYTEDDVISKVEVKYKGTETQIAKGAEIEQGKEVTISFTSKKEVASISLGTSTIITPVKKEDDGFGEFNYTYEVTVNGPNATLIITTKENALTLTVKTDESIVDGDVVYTTEPSGEILKALGKGSKVTLHVTKIKAGYTLKATSADVASVTPTEVVTTPKDIAVTMGEASATVTLSLIPSSYVLTIPSDIEGVTFAVVTKTDNTPVVTGQKFMAGTAFVVDVTVAAGASPVKFLTVNNDIVAKGADGKFAFTMPAKEVTLGVIRENEVQSHVLTFAAETDEYKLTVKQGDTQLSDQAMVEVGKPLTITVEVKDGIAKKVNAVRIGWSSATSTDGVTWTGTMPNEEATIVVTLGDSKHVLTFPETSSEYSLIVRQGGNVLKNKDQVETGAELTIATTVFSSVAKKVAKVMVGSAVATSADGGLTWKVNMPDEDATITVELKEVKRLFTFADTDDYTVTATKDGVALTSPAELDAKDKVELTITLKEGVNKTIEDVQVGVSAAKPVEGKAGVYVFEMPNADAELRVTLANPKHTLTIGKQEGITVSVNVGTSPVTSGGLVEEGAKLVITVTLKDKSQEIEAVTLNDKPATLNSEDKYEIEMPKTDAVLLVKLKGGEAVRVLQFETTTPEYTLTASALKGTETVDLQSPAQVAVGAKVTLTIKIKEGVAKYVKEVKAGDLVVTRSVSDVTKWNFEMPDANVALEVVTDDITNLQSHKINVVANGADVQIFDGTRALAVGSEVKTNTVLTIKVTHVTNQIAKVTFDGRELTLDHDQYTAIMPDKDATLEVTLGDVKTPVEDAVLAAVVVAPNPFVSEFRIANYGAEEGRYDLLSLAGQLFRTGSLDAEATVVETSDLPQGLYFLQITTHSGATKTLRVVKY